MVFPVCAAAPAVPVIARCLIIKQSGIRMEKEDIVCPFCGPLEDTDAMLDAE